MKLLNIFESEEINNEKVMVSLDSKKFNGLIRANETASYIIDCLKVMDTENIVNFLIIAASIFMFIKFINRLTAKMKKEEEEKAEEEKKEDPQTKILEEIRDELKKSNKKSAK